MVNISLQTILEQAELFSFSDQDLSNLLNMPEKLVKAIRKMFKDGEPESKIEVLLEQKKIYTIDEIKTILSFCAEGLDIDRVGLIGSYAKGNPTASSDLDILIFDTDDETAWDKDDGYALFEKRVKAVFEVPVDILYYTAVLKSPLKNSLLERVVNVYGKEL